MQARFQARYVAETLGWTSVLVAARNAEKRAACVADLAKDLAAAGVTVAEAESVQALAKRCGVIVTTTSATEPVLPADVELPESCVIVAMGAVRCFCF